LNFFNFSLGRALQLTQDPVNIALRALNDFHLNKEFTSFKVELITVASILVGIEICKHWGIKLSNSPLSEDWWLSYQVNEKEVVSISQLILDQIMDNLKMNL
jgi:hypothetical protein